MRKDLPKSARANIGIRGEGGGQGGGGQPGQGVSFQLVGDSTQTLSEIANDLIPILAKRKELRDVRVDVGDQNSELNVRVDRERAAAFGFSAEEVARFVSLALRGAPLREFRRGERVMRLAIHELRQAGIGLAGDQARPVLRDLHR